MSTTELVPSVSIANMVNQRAAVMEKMSAAIALIREAAAVAQAGHLGMPRVTLSTSYGRSGSDCQLSAAFVETRRDGSTWEREQSHQADIEKQLRIGVDAAAWQYLMHQSGMRSLMDATAREKWDGSIVEGNFPEFTEPNIRSTFKMLHDSRGDIFERGVLACFKSLSWSYKTNLPQKFGKRIVVTYLAGSGYGYKRCSELDDLMRVFHVLDGKPEPDHRGGISSMLRASNLDSFSSKAGYCENDYLSIRVFKNRNGHVTFKRLDLVERMNKIIAKHYPGALPAPK